MGEHLPVHGVGVGVGVAVGVGLGVGPDCAQYLPPVLKVPVSIYPPQTIISLPVQTASRPSGAFVVLVAVQLFVLGSYIAPVFKPPLSSPPQTIILLPVHTAVCIHRLGGALTVLVPCPAIGAGIVSAASVCEPDHVIISAPDDHFAAAPDGRMRLSSRRRTGGAGSCPTVRTRIVSAARIQKATTIPAPNHHLSPSPDSRVCGSSRGCVSSAGSCPTVRVGLYRAPVLKLLPLLPPPQTIISLPDQTAVWPYRAPGVLVVLAVAQLSVLGSYLPPVFRSTKLEPPQIIISLPVQTAVCCVRASGALVMLVASQVSVSGLYLPPVLSPVPPQTIISLPVQTAV